jgi:hypothetical protein
MEAQRRKRNELVGESLMGGKKAPPTPSEGTATPLTDAIQMFLQHVRVHSPDKPRTARRYGAVMDHVGRIVGGKTFHRSNHAGGHRPLGWRARLDQWSRLQREPLTHDAAAPDFRMDCRNSRFPAMKWFLPARSDASSWRQNVVKPSSLLTITRRASNSKDSIHNGSR